ncbi:hypothetical protein G3O08_08570 [Cryomorpha ignava]|uniref:Uncharacterized protein n=1 Tax=Cryomorpha ignava TaxID=101383 RepID=A0A7K3WPG6_9FLAO|nr:hypothetical protein [Cryomorpha ignava]NEN23553.1 hypothetical protein [Cryomorpha ignava]
MNTKIFCLLIGFMPFFNTVTNRFELRNESNDNIYANPEQISTAAYSDFTVLDCTQSERQIVYSSEYANPIATTSAPIISGKAVYLKSVDSQGDTTQINLSTKSITLILDQDMETPGFLVFNKRGKSFCSINMGLLDFPDHFSYRCLTKDRKIITAGYLKSNPIVAHEPVRKLVNDNINKEDIDLVLSDNIVVECYKTSNWIGSSYTVNVKVSPLELDYYRDDIIAMLNEGYAKMDNSKKLQEATADEDDSADTKNISSDGDEAIVINTNENEKEETPESETPILADESVQEAIDESESESEPEISVAVPVIEETTSNEENNRNLGARNVPKLDDTITPEEKEAIQREAEDKLYRLQDCFVMLVNRNFTAQQKQRERETTVQDLFINERANVGVSSVNSDVIANYLIGDYLLRLERMITGAYQKVEIVFSEIHKVSNFKRNPDGTWSATVTFSQQFKGFGDLDGKQLSYSDITQKNVTVIIRRVELFTGDSTPEVYWEVLLSDIGVNQTQPF